MYEKDQSWHTAKFMASILRRMSLDRRDGKKVSAGADAFTGKSFAVMQQRRDSEYTRDRLERIRIDRTQSLSSYLRHGARWEQDAHRDMLSLYALISDEKLSRYDREKAIRRMLHDDTLLSVNSIRTPSAHSKFQKRQGATKGKGDRTCHKHRGEADV